MSCSGARRMVSSTSVCNTLQHHFSLAKQREWPLLCSSGLVPHLLQKCEVLNPLHFLLFDFRTCNEIEHARTSKYFVYHILIDTTTTIINFHFIYAEVGEVKGFVYSMLYITHVHKNKGTQQNTSPVVQRGTHHRRMQIIFYNKTHIYSDIYASLLDTR